MERRRSLSMDRGSMASAFGCVRSSNIRASPTGSLSPPFPATPSTLSFFHCLQSLLPTPRRLSRCSIDCICERALEGLSRYAHMHAGARGHEVTWRAAFGFYSAMLQRNLQKLIRRERDEIRNITKNT